MTFTFPFDCKTRNGQDATILGYSRRKSHLIGFLQHGGICNYWGVDGRNRFDGSVDGADLILPFSPKPGKSYRTRGGLVAKINLRSAHPRQQDRPLCGHIIYADGSIGTQNWFDDGRLYASMDTNFDLIEEITNDS